MNIVWQLHHRLKSILPQTTIKRLRFLVEAYSDSIWRREYYAQFGEDAVMQSLLLSRVWAEVENRGEIPNHNLKLQSGFYIDIGAYAPKQYSNTYWFYKHGWQGINIDATPGSMKVFDRIRKRDINVEAAISDEERELIFYSWGSPMVCNTLSAEHAQEYTKRMGGPPQQIILRTSRLESILDKHVPANQPIDFMSIDVEAHNLEVLRSNNWTKYRPSFIIVEVDYIDISDVINTEITKFLASIQYRICSCVGPSVIFESIR
jgi:FkbM family methyltransferase